MTNLSYATLQWLQVFLWLVKISYWLLVVLNVTWKLATNGLLLFKPLTITNSPSFSTNIQIIVSYHIPTCCILCNRYLCWLLVCIPFERSQEWCCTWQFIKLKHSWHNKNDTNDLHSFNLQSFFACSFSASRLGGIQSCAGPVHGITLHLAHPQSLTMKLNTPQVTSLTAEYFV